MIKRKILADINRAVKAVYPPSSQYGYLVKKSQGATTVHFGASRDLIKVQHYYSIYSSSALSFLYLFCGNACQTQK